jgi:hypothetical protein
VPKQLTETEIQNLRTNAGFQTFQMLLQQAEVQLVNLNGEMAVQARQLKDMTEENASLTKQLAILKEKKETQPAVDVFYDPTQPVDTGAALRAEATARSLGALVEAAGGAALPIEALQGGGGDSATNGAEPPMNSSPASPELSSPPAI